MADALITAGGVAQALGVLLLLVDVNEVRRYLHRGMGMTTPRGPTVMI